MSRSRKKVSIIGNLNCRSEKQDKREYNRLYRRIFKQTLFSNIEVEIFPNLKEFSDPWLMSKDGRRYFDAKESPKFMRK